jgi:hypothetical protein
MIVSECERFVRDGMEVFKSGVATVFVVSCSFSFFSLFFFGLWVGVCMCVSPHFSPSPFVCKDHGLYSNRIRFYKLNVIV